MAITGERKDILTASLGDGDLIVFGLANKNQLDIVENAHHATVTQIVSLQKLKNKYFASRCVLGHVNIWSATHHPDRLFTIENIDKDEPSTTFMQHDQTAAHLNQTAAHGHEGMNTTHGGNFATGMGTSASERDRMIELKFTLQNQSSSTVLCFSNYNDQQILIAIVDLKTRRKNIIKTFKNQRRPTVLLQIDESNLLVGTEGGKIEHWGIESEQLIQVFDAHTKSEEGISSIRLLNSNHYLIWGAQNDLDKVQNRILATASLGCSDFRLWLMSLDTSKGQYALSLQPHIRIETSLQNGIRYLLEASETQLVAVDTVKTLKFYEFIDKELKEKEERRKEWEEKQRKIWKAMLQKYDKDNSGFVTKEEMMELSNDYCKIYCPYYQVDLETANSYLQSLDTNQDGKLNLYELQGLMTFFVNPDVFEQMVVLEAKQ